MLDSQLLPCTTATTSTTTVANANANAAALTDCLAKVRKPYTITKQREKWTEEEHDKFLEALKLHGRAWRNIEDHVGTKTAVQIRSHAQKFFFKLERKSGHGQEEEKEGVDIEIPPPRPKRKPTHPYPRKAAASALIQDSGPISTTSTSTSGMLYSTLLPSLSPLIQDPPLIPPPFPAPPVQAHPSLSCFRLFGQTVEVVLKGRCGSESSDSTSDIIDSNTKVIAGSHEASHGLLYHPLVAAAESSFSLFANTCHKEGETGNPKLDSLHHSGGCFKPWHLPKTGIEAKTETGKAPSDGDGYIGFDSVAWWALNRTALLASADGYYFRTGHIQPEKAFFSDDESLCSNKTMITEEEENTPKGSRGNNSSLYDHHHHHHRRLLYHSISMGNDSGSIDQNSESEGEGEGEEEEDTVYSTGLQCMGMAKVLSVQCYKTDPTNKEEVEDEEEEEEEGGIVGPFFGSRGLSRLAPSGFSPYQAPT